MTVRELIKLLKACSPNDIVVMSSDPEGNSFAPLAFVDGVAYNFDGELEIGLRQLTDEDRKAGYCEDDVKAGTPCVVLWP